MYFRLHLTLVVFAALAVFVSTVHADDEIATGKTKAQMCIVCHGQFGYSTAPNAPHLANQPEQYLRDQLRAFRNGSRTHQVMGVVAKGLSDSDIEVLAAWFSSIEIEVREP